MTLGKFALFSIPTSIVLLVIGVMIARSLDE